MFMLVLVSNYLTDTRTAHKFKKRLQIAKFYKDVTMPGLLLFRADNVAKFYFMWSLMFMVN